MENHRITIHKIENKVGTGCTVPCRQFWWMIWTYTMTWQNLSQNSWHASRKISPSWGCKKHAKMCWDPDLMKKIIIGDYRVWFIMSTLLMIKLSTKRTTCKFSVVSKIQCITRDQNCGNKATGSSTTTTLPPIHHISFKIFWPNTESHKCGRSPTLQTWVPANGCSPNWRCH